MLQKKLISSVLVTAMALSVFGTAVFADETEEFDIDQPEEITETIEESQESDISEEVITEETLPEETIISEETDSSEDQDTDESLISEEIIAEESVVSEETEVSDEVVPEETEIVEDIEDEDVSPDNDWMMNTFPDDDFRNYVLDLCDKNNNNIIDDSELSIIRNTTSIVIDGRSPYNFAGIDQFTGLKELTIKKVSTFSSIDLSRNTKLETIMITNCTGLTTLKLGTNNNLTTLHAYGNNLKTIDVSGCPNLTSLRINKNALKSVNVSNNNKLEELYVNSNSSLNTLNVKNCRGLRSLNIGSTEIKSIDISNCPYLAGAVYNSGGASTNKYIFSDGGVVYVLSCDADTSITTNFGVPSSVSVSLTSSTAALVSWSQKSSHPETGYEVSRSTSQNGTYTVLGNVTSTSRSCTNHSAGKTYWFRVRPYIQYPSGTKVYYNGYSTPKSVSTGSAPVPNTPTGLKATVTSMSTVSLEWNAVSSYNTFGYSVFYEMWRSTTPDFTESTRFCIGRYSDTESVSKLLTPDKQYYFRVRAYFFDPATGSRYYGSYSNVASVKTYPMLSNPSWISCANNGTNGTITVAWGSVTASGSNMMYELWRMNSSTNTPGICLGRYSSTSAVSKNLTVGNAYYYRVRAYYYYTDSAGVIHRVYGPYSSIIMSRAYKN